MFLSLAVAEFLYKNDCFLRNKFIYQKYDSIKETFRHDNGLFVCILTFSKLFLGSGGEEKMNKMASTRFFFKLPHFFISPSDRKLNSQSVDMLY